MINFIPPFFKKGTKDLFLKTKKWDKVHHIKQILQSRDNSVEETIAQLCCKVINGKEDERPFWKGQK